MQCLSTHTASMRKTTIHHSHQACPDRQLTAHILQRPHTGERVHKPPIASFVVDLVNYRLSFP